MNMSSAWDWSSNGHCTCHWPMHRDLPVALVKLTLKEAARKAHDVASAALEKVSSQTAAEATWRRDVESQLLEQVHKAREEGAHRARQDAKLDHESAMSSLREGHREALSHVAASHASQLQALQDSHTNASNVMRKELEASLNQHHRVRMAENIALLEDEHASKLAQLSSSHASALFHPRHPRGGP